MATRTLLKPPREASADRSDQQHPPRWPEPFSLAGAPERPSTGEERKLPERPPKPPADPPSSTLHVGGIQGDIEDEAKLEELFAKFGSVEAVTLRRRRGIKNGKEVVSWALIEYTAADSATQALENKDALSSLGLVVRLMDKKQAS